MKSSAMHIVLLDRIRNLGAIGDVVAVRRGYARNYLLPQGKALRATKANIEEMEKKRKELETRDQEALKEAHKQQQQLQDMQLTFIRQASESGQLYGSVSVRDIKDALTESKQTVPSEHIMLHDRIKEVGVHRCLLALHADVTVTVMLNVARNEDEAQSQWQSHLNPPQDAKHTERQTEKQSDKESSAKDTEQLTEKDDSAD